MVQSTDIRVQKMALKAINNVLTDCEPHHNQEAFLREEGTLVFLRMLLTLPLQTEEVMFTYVLNILSSLLLCEFAVEEITSRGIKPLLRTFTLASSHHPVIASMVMHLFSVISARKDSSPLLNAANHQGLPT